METLKKILSQFLILSLIFNIFIPVFGISITNAQGNLNITNTSNNGKNNNKRDKYIEGEVIIKYKETSGDIKTSSFGNNKENGIKSMGFTMGKRFGNINMMSVKSDKKSTLDMIKEMKKDKDIEYIQPNFIYYTESNDTSYSELWGLDNIGQTVNGVSGTSDIDMDWSEAITKFSGTSNGTGVIVAVIDTGVDYNHEDLINKMWDGSNCKDHNGNLLGGCLHGYDYDNNDNNPIDIAADSHGTHVAGTIAAEGNNSKGIIGVNPESQIMALTGLSSTTAVVKAINFAKYNGAKIINASWGGYFLTGVDCTDNSLTPVVDQALYDSIKSFGDTGGLFVAAAGNAAYNHDEPSTRMFPSGYGSTFECSGTTFQGLDNIISVAAIDNNGAIASFSDYGSNSVHIGAAGVNIYSTQPGNTYAFKNGTSMATPNVAGAASLAWSYKQDRTNIEIKNAILNSGDNLASLNGKTITGKSLNLKNTLDYLDANSANIAPTTTGISDVSYNESTNINLDISGSFNDVDGDTLSYTATGLFSGLSISGIGVIAGTLPIVSSIENHSITVTANDGNGKTVSDTFIITINNNIVNTAPTTIGISDISYNEGNSIMLNISSKFNDADGDTLSYTAIGLASGLSISGVGVITGTLPLVTSVENHSITVTANDGNGGTVSDTFVLVINNIFAFDDAPNLVSKTDTTVTISWDTLDTAFGYYVYYGTTSVENGDAISYEFELPDLLEGTGAIINGLLEGQTYYISIVGMDEQAEQTPYAPELIVTIDSAVNEAPTTTGIADVSYNEATTISLDISPYFSDADGNTLTYTATGLVTGLSISSIGAITGTLPSTTSVETHSITVTANDGNGGTVSDEFILTINNDINEIPVTTGILDYTSLEAEEFLFNSAISFDDPNGDTLSYTATGLLDGLSISGTGYITGTLPSVTSVENHSITVTANDGNGGIVSDEFILTISNNINELPTTTGIIDKVFNEQTSIIFDTSIYFSDPNGDNLAYTSTGLVDGLSMSSTGVITGSLGELQATSTGVVTVTVNDGNGGTLDDSFIMTINDTTNNNSPTSTGIIDVTYDEGVNISLDVSSYFIDIDGDELSYTATGLLTGLSLSSTGLITGIANVEGNYVGNIKVTANDGKTGIVDDIFTLTINNLINDINGTSNSNDGYISLYNSGTTEFVTGLDIKYGEFKFENIPNGNYRLEAFSNSVKYESYTENISLEYDINKTITFVEIEEVEEIVTNNHFEGRFDRDFATQGNKIKVKLNSNDNDSGVFSLISGVDIFNDNATYLVLDGSGQITNSGSITLGSDNNFTDISDKTITISFELKDTISADIKFIKTNFGGFEMDLPIYRIAFDAPATVKENSNFKVKGIAAKNANIEVLYNGNIIGTGIVNNGLFEIETQITNVGNGDLQVKDTVNNILSTTSKIYVDSNLSVLKGYTIKIDGKDIINSSTNSDVQYFSVWTDKNMKIKSDINISSIFDNIPDDIEYYIGEEKADSLGKITKGWKGYGSKDVVVRYTKDNIIYTQVIAKVIILIDPSGYLYNSDTNAKIGGIKSTLYKLVDANGDYVISSLGADTTKLSNYTSGGYLYNDLISDLDICSSGILSPCSWESFDAETYSQVNPQYTGIDGKFSWDTPEGYFYVKYEDTDGDLNGGDYGVFDSFALKIPPVVTDLNIGRTSVCNTVATHFDTGISECISDTQTENSTNYDKTRTWDGTLWSIWSYTCKNSYTGDDCSIAPVIEAPVSSGGGGGGGGSYSPTCKDEQLICKKAGNTFRWYRGVGVNCKNGNLAKECSLDTINNIADNTTDIESINLIETIAEQKTIKKNALSVTVVSKIVKLKTEEYNDIKNKYTKVFENIDKELSYLVYISEDINILRYKLRTTYKDWLNGLRDIEYYYSIFDFDEAEKLEKDVSKLFKTAINLKKEEKEIISNAGIIKEDIIGIKGIKYIDYYNNDIDKLAIKLKNLIIKKESNTDIFKLSNELLYIVNKLLVNKNLTIKEKNNLKIEGKEVYKDFYNKYSSLESRKVQKYVYIEPKDNTEDSLKINHMAICTMDYNPVCGIDNRTYSNACVAEKQSGVKVEYKGACNGVTNEILDENILIVKVFSVKLAYDKDLKYLQAWMKEGDKVELLEKVNKYGLLRVKIISSDTPRYIGREGYIYEKHLSK